MPSPSPQDNRAEGLPHTPIRAITALPNHPLVRNSWLMSLSQELLFDLLLIPSHDFLVWPRVKPGSNKTTLRQVLVVSNPFQ